MDSEGSKTGDLAFDRLKKGNIESRRRQPGCRESVFPRHFGRESAVASVDYDLF